MYPALFLNLTVPQKRQEKRILVIFFTYYRSIIGILVLFKQLKEKIDLMCNEGANGGVK